MFPARVFKSLRAAIKKTIHTVSLLNMLAYVKEYGGSVKWPPVTYLAFLVRSILTLKIRWQVISVKPTGVCSSTSSTWRATLLFTISLAIAFYQRMSPFSRSKLNSKFIFLALFFRVWLTHHLKTGSSDSLLLSAYSASSIRVEDLTVERGCYDTDPSFHLTWMLQPLVVIIGFLTLLTVVYPLSFLHCCLIIYLCGVNLIKEVFVPVIAPNLV